MVGNRTRVARLIVAGLVVASLSMAACVDQQRRDYAAIAHAVADTLDALNGLPTVVVDAYWCDHRSEACIPVSASEAISPREASDLAGPFASALGVPVVNAQDVVPLDCPWKERPARATGMYAQFVRPPVITGVEARVRLESGCAGNDGAFAQEHEFVLRRVDGTWRVVRRTLMWIT